MRKLDFQHAKALFTDMCDHALLLDPGLAPGRVTTSLHALRLILKPISSANLLAFPIFPYDDIRSMSSWEVY
jgi:hypothetical protein